MKNFCLHPRHGEGFKVGKTFHGFDHSFFVTKSGVFDSTEGRHFNSITRYFPNIDGSMVEFIDEPGDVIEPVGADT